MSKKRNKYAGDVVEAYDPTGISQYLGLGRPIDFDNFTTKSAMMATIAVCVVVTLWKTASGLSSTDAVVVSLGYALNFLLCYMLALELDPDRQFGGIIGGIVSLGATFICGEGNILVSLWMLFILRMFNRSSGDRHRIADNAIIILSAAWLGREGFWIYPMLTGAAYVLESQIKAGYTRSLYLAGMALFGLFFSEYGKVPNVISPVNIYLMATAFIIYLPAMRVLAYTQAKGDKNEKRLFPTRLQTMAGFFLMTIFTVTFLHGNEAVKSLMPAACAAFGAGVYMFIALTRRQISFKK